MPIPERNAYSTEYLPPNGPQGPEQDERELETIDLAAFTRLVLPVRRRILSPILPERGLAMLYAGRGVGKTYASMGLVWAVACGSEFLKWKAPAPRRVLYVDGEMPQEVMQERALEMIAASSCCPPNDDHFKLLSMDRQQPGSSLNLAIPSDQERLECKLQERDLLVLDNVSTLVNGGRENDAESWSSMQSWLLDLRRKGVSVLLVHHTGRGDNARGTSKREDVLDTVIYLKRPEDYDVEEGARFEVHLTKARGVYGEEALPFEAKLEKIDGKDYWTCTTLRNRDLDEVEELSLAGMAVREIADKTKLSRSKVNRMQQKLRAEGRL